MNETIKVRANRVPCDCSYITAGKIYDAKYLRESVEGGYLCYINQGNDDGINIVVGRGCAT